MVVWNIWALRYNYFSMSLTFYLPRRLSSNGKIFTEQELISASSYVVLLAEPGAGKTKLMGSLAQQLGVSVVTASKFRYGKVCEKNIPLVIDAFDELAKVANAGIFELLGKAASINPTHVFLSSRSSEWDRSATNVFEEFFEQPPVIATLCEFDVQEQRSIFEQHAPGEDFLLFQTEVARFGLEMLLPNPQFLKLFADAYIESARRFTNKQAIFSQAVERLAREVNDSVVRVSPNLSVGQKVALSSEIFIKLLLSGAEGISTSEVKENRMYPLLASLVGSNTAANNILASRLFKPGDNAEQHRPVHKIIAEYCAARYLIKRMEDPADPLTLFKCLPIIAPNSTVRDELRGLLGWMAALGNKSIEEASIELDPYAVLANGDPSQLEPSSKLLLVKQLKVVQDKDPYFRRGDFWRRFSVAGFFTSDVIEEIKPILSTENDSHLRDLVLELLTGPPGVGQLRDEFRQLALGLDVNENTRLLASRCLFSIKDHDYHTDLTTLVSQGSHISLNIVAKAIETICPETFDLTFLADFFRACTALYPNHHDYGERIIGERYFVRRVVFKLNLETIEWLLDELTGSLACNCGKQPYECDCRTGLSKVVGLMLDRYFDLAKPPFDPKRVWQWVGNLNFQENKTVNQSKSVEVLQKNDILRQGIIAHVFGKMTDRDQIYNTKIYQFDWHSHSGLFFRPDDYRFLVDLAFETDNPDLWVSFMATHNFYQNKEKQGVNSLRQHMRAQALKKPSFMQEWAKSNRSIARQQKQNSQFPRFRRTRRMKRQRKAKQEVRAKNIAYIQENRTLVEGGQHWDCLVHFADLVLNYPDKIVFEFGEETLVRNALRSCLDFIAPNVPDLGKLAELQCASQYPYSVKILYAACLEILRTKGTLEDVDLRLLKALRTGINMGYRAVTQEDFDALKSEINNLIFTDVISTENFLRQYLEPQLALNGCDHAEVWLLREDEAFSHVRAALSIEWLRRFRGLPFKALEMLFEIAAEYSNRLELIEIIRECREGFEYDVSSLENHEESAQKLAFWSLRAFYFLNDDPKKYLSWLKKDRDTIHLLYELSGRISHRDRPYWPKLTSVKIEAILDAFIDKWPQVELPSHWGTGSPKEESAYRFLTEVIWLISSDNPDDAIPVLDRLLADIRFESLHKDLRSIHAGQVRKKALKDFEPPTPQEIVILLNEDKVVTVEGLRQLVLQELQCFQRVIDGGEFNSIDRFYEKNERLDEKRCTEVIAERLSLRLEPQGISVTLEHQLKNLNRSDFTVTKMINGRRRLLVTEVKGQWHKDLYTAASAQLHERYSIHPDAEQQGIFLVVWFGEDEAVAGRKRHGICSARKLKSSIEAKLPKELSGLIDVFVLDVSNYKS